MKNSTVKFRQSLDDFPLVVSLGKKNPAWGLSRFGDACDLRFVPVDDEGFSLRGDSRQLLYKGHRRSHRFTILGDGAFEYDCILLREPESNTIALRMEGAERFDFLKQPDFVLDDFLKGSYAVYKKETFFGEGTGKLCHIHRPKIIDACGRWCWGDLSIVGNELLIIIPESFLSNAKYPVVVDPTVGTTTVGSQTTWYDPDNDDYSQLYIEASLAVNRFLIPESLNNTATAYVYAYESDYDGRCMPVLYSDNNNAPLSRRSMNEGNFDIAVRNGKPAGWRSTTFKPNTSIASGTYVWFGLFCDWFYPRFDFGARCYKDFHEDEISNTYPLYDKNNYFDFKLSMYFSYTSAQNYVRTLTQGVKLTDTRKRTSLFKRNLTQNVNVQHGNSPYYSVLFIRYVNNKIVVYETTQKTADYIKILEVKAKTSDKTPHIADYHRVHSDAVQADGLVLRSLTLFVKIMSGTFIRDYIIRRFLKAREELRLKSCISREVFLDSRII